MDNKELISSVKSVLARLQSFGVSREDLRNLLVLLFLLRWLRDEMSSFTVYNGERDSLKLADRLNALFSSNINLHEIDHHVHESLNLLRYSIKVEGLSELDFSSKNHLFKDKRVVMEALYWFNQWGGLRLDRRKDISQLFEVILQETRTPQTIQFSSSKLISQLIVAIAAPKSGETILDPCVGEGSFLIAAHNAIEAADTDFLSQTSFTGYDISEDAILIAMVRFFLSERLTSI
ncbi:SAM-dependent methyltransferase [Vibrio parahaemolyticus]|nr:SAM-dependent methyltransferase [Vibrio parahaemolyticus]